MARVFVLHSLIASIFLVACSSRDLTRSKAADLIKNDVSFATPVKRLPLQEKGRFNGKSDAGEMEGLWQSSGERGKFALTDAGRKFFERDFSDRELIPLREAGHRTVIDVTGITSEPMSGDSIKVALFTWHYDNLADIVARYTGEASATHNGEATFQLFDDGWRLQKIDLHEQENLTPFAWTPELEKNRQQHLAARRLNESQALELAKVAIKDHEPVVNISLHPAWNIPATNFGTGQPLAMNEARIRSLQKLLTDHNVNAVGVGANSGYYQVQAIEPPADWAQYERASRFGDATKTYAFYRTAEVSLTNLNFLDAENETASSSVAVTYSGCTPACELAKAIETTEATEQGWPLIDKIFVSYAGNWKPQDSGIVYYQLSPDGQWRVSGVK